MTPRALPRPRSLDEVADLVSHLAARIETVAESQLVVSGQIGHLTAEVAGLRSGRDWREQSRHDWDPGLLQLGQVLREQVKDPTRPQFNSDRAKAIVDDAVSAARRDDKAAAYDAWRRGAVRIVVGVVIGVLVAMLLAHYGVHP